MPRPRPRPRPSDEPASIRRTDVSDPRSEFADLLASARVVVTELLEEGIEQFDATKTGAGKAADDAKASPSSSPSSPPSSSPPSSPSPSASVPVARSKPARASTPEATRAPAREANLPDPSLAWGPTPTLDAVEQTLGDCRRCELCQGRKRIVFGDGNPEADLLFVGEGPGQREDEQGLPFVGKAGELLTKMIENGLGIPRQTVYICNIVKCRPPNNRDPLPAEVEACRAFLDGQIAAVRPKVIVSLGRPAASLLLGRKVAISRERGTWHSYQGIPLMPTLHPAFVLRQYSEENRRAVWEDLKAAHARATTDGPA